MFRRLLCMTCLLTMVVLPARADEKEPAKEQKGNALPEGALARLGTVNWRHEDIVSFAAFLPTGKAVVSVGDDQTIRLWEYPSGKLLNRIDLYKKDEPPSDPICQAFEAVAMSGDGKVLATCFRKNKEPNTENQIRLFDLTTLKELPAVAIEVNRAIGTPNVEALFLTANGDQLVCKDYSRINVYDRKSGMKIYTLNTNNNPISGRFFAVTPDEKSLIVFDSRQIKILDLATGKEARSIEVPAIKKGNGRSSIPGFLRVRCHPTGSK